MKTTRRGRLKVKRKDSKIPTANELVFLKRSPDYCHQNGTIGSLGKILQHASSNIQLDKNHNMKQIQILISLSHQLRNTRPSL